jgi:putative oxidoreductase
MQFLEPHRERLLGVLRIVAGLCFLQHGTTKYLHFPATKMSGASPMTMGGAAGLIELIGGAWSFDGMRSRGK